MQIIETELNDVWRIIPEVNTDYRGKYLMIHHEDEYDAIVPDVHFVEWDIVTSKKYVFRGIHYSPNCWKVYQCLNGEILYIFVNCDKDDPEYGKWAWFHLEPFDQLLKHPKYGAGMWTLQDNTILHYAQSQYYDPDNPDQKTFKYDEFDIWYPNFPMILSKRDDQGYYEHEQK